jgi:hypothetical protein
VKKNFSTGIVAGLVAGVCAGLLAGSAHLQAQQATPAADPVPLKAAPAASAPGSVMVTRLTDSSFVVVKDQGDAQVVTLFSTEGGIIKKLHSGKFLY